MKKEENLTPDYLQWLVTSRTANQTSALELFKLFNEHPEIPKTIDCSKTAQNLVAACFSLWRAAFLADRTATRHAVFDDAKSFLARLLTDNAIAYPQDRNSREWTFNYYMNNARGCLVELSAQWPSVNAALIAKYPKSKGTTTAQRRWNRQQKAFEVAINCFAKDLKEKPSKPKKKAVLKEPDA